MINYLKIRDNLIVKEEEEKEEEKEKEKEKDEAIAHY